MSGLERTVERSNMNRYVSNKIKSVQFILTVMIVMTHSYTYDLQMNKSKVLIDYISYDFYVQGIIMNLLSIAVPMFFVISGYLFFYNLNKNNNIIDKIKKKYKSLVLPYILWNLLHILLFYLIQISPILNKFLVQDRVDQYNFYDWINSIFINPMAGQLWFVRNLIVYVLLTPLIYLLIKNINPIQLILIIALNYFIPYDRYLIINRGGFIIYFIIGGYLAFKGVNINFNDKVTKILTAFFIIMCVMKVYIRNGIFMYLMIFVGLISLWGLYDLFLESGNKKKRAFNDCFIRLSEYNFIVYAIHFRLAIVIKKILFIKLPKSSVFYSLNYIITVILTILLCLFISKILYKYFPKIFKILNGGRTNDNISRCTYEQAEDSNCS